MYEKGGKSMPTLTVNFSNIGTRNDVRTRVVDTFIREDPGSGTGNLASRYDYIVANLISGNAVILTRPANLKNGFDFLIRVTNINFNPNGRRRDYPTHDDIINDLLLKQNNNPQMYALLRQNIIDIYNCAIEVESINFASYSNWIGFDSDMVLHTIKWFFIEQDIRYWNYSGRAMLMNGIL